MRFSEVEFHLDKTPRSGFDWIKNIESATLASRIAYIADGHFTEYNEDEAYIARVIETIARHTNEVASHPGRQNTLLIQGLPVSKTEAKRSFFAHSPPGELRFSYEFTSDNTAPNISADNAARAILIRLKQKNDALFGPVTFKPKLVHAEQSGFWFVDSEYRLPLTPNVSLGILLTGEKKPTLLGQLWPQSLHDTHVKYTFRLHVADADGSVRQYQAQARHDAVMESFRKAFAPSDIYRQAVLDDPDALTSRHELNFHSPADLDFHAAVSALDELFANQHETNAPDRPIAVIGFGKSRPDAPEPDSEQTTPSSSVLRLHIEESEAAYDARKTLRTQELTRAVNRHVEALLARGTKILVRSDSGEETIYDTLLFGSIRIPGNPEPEEVEAAFNPDAMKSALHATMPLLPLLEEVAELIQSADIADEKIPPEEERIPIKTTVDGKTRYLMVGIRTTPQPNGAGRNVRIRIWKEDDITVRTALLRRALYGDLLSTPPEPTANPQTE